MEKIAKEMNVPYFDVRTNDTGAMNVPKVSAPSISRAELDVFIARMTDKGIPVCVNVPEELIRRIPTYIGNRVCFVNCESEAMLCNEASDLVINTALGSLKDLI